MRTSTPILLLIFLHLTSAAPISLKGCATYTECRDLISSALPTTPHFPAHQLSPLLPSADLYQKLRIDNRPITPASTLAPTRALAAQVPLTSTYLMTLSRLASLGSSHGASKSSHTDDALPAKPTSALPELRKADGERYWIELVRNAPEEVASVSDGREEAAGGVARTQQRTYTVRYVRNYNDMMVVGIVVLFLAVVIVLELAQKIGDLNSRRRRHGAIFLADDEEVAFVVKRPFVLQPAPAPRKTNLLTTITTTKSPVVEITRDAEIDDSKIEAREGVQSEKI